MGCMKLIFAYKFVYFISANSKCNATQGDKPVICLQEQEEIQLQSSA